MAEIHEDEYDKTVVMRPGARAKPVVDPEDEDDEEDDKTMIMAP